MKSIQEVFTSLAQRLYSLKTPSFYVPNFDFKKIMDDIESDIVIHPHNVAAKEANKYLLQVSALIQENRDFFKDFVRIEQKAHTWQDEHGNICSEEEISHVPLPEWQKNSVNENIQFELCYYHAILNKLSDYLLAGNTTELKENECRFQFKFFETEPDKLTDLLKSLKGIEFVCAETNLRNFKNCFGGRSAITEKIRWSGTIPALSYFIKRLHSEGAVIEKKGSNKWIITESVFCDENGNNYTSDLGRQKLPKEKDIKLIDKMISNLLK